VLSPAIFKANDIRGVATGPHPEWDEAGARALGLAYGHLLGPGATVVVSRDMRPTGPALQAAFTDGLTRQGVNAILAGLSSTDQLWFDSGFLDLPGAQFTASHNPATYNGLKFCRAQAQPVSPEFLVDLAELAQRYDRGELAPDVTLAPGSVTERDLLGDYAAYLHQLVPLQGRRHFKVVVDAGNGMAGHTVPAVLGPLDVEVVGLYLDLDGNFPNHEPNPLVPANRVDAQNAVKATGADLALIFDGDADRCFVIDERGETVSPSAITALIAVAELQREPGATIVINTITSDAVREIVAEHGGQTVESRVGHTYVKAEMARHHAIFGGEHSAHYYFRDFWGADTGLLAGLHVLAQLDASDGPLSELVAAYTRYVASGEINSTVTDAPATMAHVAAAFAGRGEARWGDGVKVVGPGWWFNLRPSNTEPLLRLNVEATSADQMAGLRDEVLDLVHSKETA
jgi:phosphomannomutase